MKRLAITMRVVETPEYKETRDAISHDWLRFLKKLGYLPILIPNIMDDPINYIRHYKIEALILSNGNHVCVEKRINNDNSSVISNEKDDTEYRLLNYAIERKLPVLGICRGMQLINKYFNGNIRKLNSKSNHVSVDHEIEITNDHFADMLGHRLTVNSFHMHGIATQDLSPKLKVFASHTQTNICEGIYHPNLPILGIQWHPERPNPAWREDQILINSFLEKRTLQI